MGMKDILRKEIDRIDTLKSTKRKERIIEGFEGRKAIISGKEYLVFNSNDYLGLRLNKDMIEAEHEAAKIYGTGPGAVRFISGSLKIYKDLEKEIARFHGREDAMLFSSAFAANIGVLHALIKGVSKDSVLGDNVLVISDQLNHRSIIDGIRIAELDKSKKTIFRHLDLEDFKRILEENKGKFSRVIAISDGVFSMLGENQDIAKMAAICRQNEENYPEGIILIIDDAHGIGVLGEGSRGTEELTGGKADILVGTLGKALGSDGGYVVSDKIYIDYLRESAATYIYSNGISPGSAGAGLRALEIISESSSLKDKLSRNVNLFKRLSNENKIKLAAESQHAIQPVHIGDTSRARQISEQLFLKGMMVTPIIYPVVAKGADEIRIQLSALHEEGDIKQLVKDLAAFMH